MTTTNENRRDNLIALLEKGGHGAIVDMARRANLSTQTITDVKAGRKNLGEKAARKIEDAFGFTNGYLDKQNGQSITTQETNGISDQRNGYSELSNVVPIRLQQRQLPLLDWEGLQHSTAAIKPENKRKINVTLTKPIGSNAFALTVEDYSMAPNYPPGARLIIDPDAPTRNGSLVIASHPDWPTATFKKLVQDAGTRTLVPLNPAHPHIPIANDVQIVGKVVQVIIEPE